MHGPRREGWAPLPPAEEPGRGRRRQVEEVEGEAAAGERRARGGEAAAGPGVSVAAAERPRRPRGGGAATGQLGRPEPWHRGIEPKSSLVEAASRLYRGLASRHIEAHRACDHALLRRGSRVDVEPSVEPASSSVEPGIELASSRIEPVSRSLSRPLS